VSLRFIHLAAIVVVFWAIIFGLTFIVRRAASKKDGP
jgi:hypothetical protein